MPPHRLPWPTAQHYRDAVLDPQGSFEDAELRQAEPVCDKDGCPLFWTGASAVVFRLRWPSDPQKDFAVKCFKKPVRGRQERYRRLSQCLSDLRGRGRRPSFMVDFQYLRDQEEEREEPLGILIDEEWFPVVKMAWVEGQTLREIVAQYLHRKSALEQLCAFWERLAKELHEAELAHLDLQHGNVLWLPGTSAGKVRPRLIDYDGMWTPTLAQLPSPELGVVHYQHPERHPGQNRPPPYRPEADRFSHLVIYSALRSLSVLGPELWTLHDNGDNLLFSREDFEYCRRNGQERPRSRLLHQLWTHGADEVKWLAGRLVLAANGPLEQVPLLHEVVSDAQVQPLNDRDIEQVQRILGLHVENEYVNTLGMKFVRVPRGTFWMSENGMHAQRQVEIPDDFYLGFYQVTQEQWQTVMGNNPSWFSRTGNGEDKVKSISDDELKQYPVESVSWKDAQEFIKKLNKIERGRGYLYRLPTETEWEFACRGGATSIDECSFDFYLEQPTNDLSSTQANFDGNHPAGSARKGPFLGRTTKVGSYPANRLGLYDMHGNVWEWCQDLYTEGGAARVSRGGGWGRSGFSCQAAHCSWDAPTYRSLYLGCRLARVPVR